MTKGFRKKTVFDRVTDAFHNCRSILFGKKKVQTNHFAIFFYYVWILDRFPPREIKKLDRFDASQRQTVLC